MNDQNTTQTIEIKPASQEVYKGRGALDTFFNLLVLVTFGWTAIAFGGVIFQIINRVYGNYALGGYDSQYYSWAMKFNVASLIIVMPIFLVLSGILHKMYKAKKLSYSSGVHRWLTYLMLFVAFCNIIGSLIAVVFKFLDGVFFSAFILKAITIFIIALGVFGYSWYDLKRQSYEIRSKISAFSAGALVVLSIAAIIGGFVITGSPQKARKLNFDKQRVQDLSNIRYQINEYERIYKKLPSDLSDSRFARFNDPENKQPYEYSLISSNEYELCANFSLAVDPAQRDKYNYYDYGYGSESWNYHGSGRQCYSLKIEQSGTSKPIPAPIPVNP